MQETGLFSLLSLMVIIFINGGQESGIRTEMRVQIEEASGSHRIKKELN